MLEEKVAIITGGNRGIGKEIARAFAKAQAKIVIAARGNEELEQTALELKKMGAEVHHLTVDVTNPEQVNQLVEETIKVFKKVDILVNNAGTAGPTKQIEDWTEAELDAVIGSNIKGSFLCTAKVVKYMKQQNSGRIINISSISGKRPLPFRVGYTTAKMGIIGMTRTLAAELGPFNITVNAICPGFVSGERMTHVIEQQSLKRNRPEAEVMSEFVSASPLNRFVDPTDIASMATFLASNAAGSITGEDINVSAGVVMY